MKKQILLIALILNYLFVFSQDVKTVGDKICNCYEKNIKLNTNLVKDSCVKMIGLASSKKETDSLKNDYYLKICAYLSANCKAYLEYSDIVTKSDWKVTDDKTSKIDSKLCDDFHKLSNFYYLEAEDNDTTRVLIKDGFWHDIFKGGKFRSKCKMHWLSSCEFELSFIESTDPLRSRAFKKGDTFKYQIIEKTDNYYLTNATFKGITVRFKLYLYK